MYEIHMLIAGDYIDGVTLSRRFADRDDAVAFCNSVAAKSASIMSCGITIARWRFGSRVK